MLSGCFDFFRQLRNCLPQLSCLIQASVKMETCVVWMRWLVFMLLQWINKHNKKVWWKFQQTHTWQLLTQIRTLDLSRKIEHGIDWDTVMMIIDLFCKPAYSSSKQSCWIHACVNVWTCRVILGRLLLGGFTSQEECEHTSTIIFGGYLYWFLKCPNAWQKILTKC